MKGLKSFIKLEISIKRVVLYYCIIFSVLSLGLITACKLTNENVKENIRISAEKIMEREGVYPRYVLHNYYFQLDNWTEAEVLAFIYHNYDEEPVKTAFAERSFGGTYNGRTAEGGLERLIASINNAEKSKEYIRPSYWVGFRLFLIPLLNFMDYYQIRICFFILGIGLLAATCYILYRKVDCKLAIAVALASIVGNIPIALLNNSLGMCCILLSLFAMIYLIYHQDTNIFHFMFIIGMLTAFFDWFSLSLISYGSVMVLFMFLENKKKADATFAELFNKLWNGTVGWMAGLGLMYVGRIICSFAVIGKDAIEYFVNRLTYNTGAVNQTESNVLMDIITANAKSILGIEPLPMILELTSKKVTAIVALLYAIGILFLVYCSFKYAKNKAFISIMYIISLSPIVWITVFNKYYVKHFFIGYRVLVIAVFSFLVTMLYGVDWKKCKIRWVK